MIASDIHMHSSFSTDSDAPMASMIESAISKGLKTICFTEHLDYDFPLENGRPVFLVDMDAYYKEIEALQARYCSRIEVLFGIEFGLMPYLADRYAQTAREWPFDFIIGSSHLINGQDPYDPAFWASGTIDACCRSYFQTISDNIAAYKDFDTYGHIDYIVRYSPEKNAGYSYERYRDVLDTALRVIIDNGLCLEVNTAGYKYGLGQPNPQADILIRYRELGGERITIGADGHSPEHIAYDFDRVENLLKACGFRYHTIFRQRKPVMIPL